MGLDWHCSSFSSYRPDGNGDILITIILLTFFIFCYHVHVSESLLFFWCLKTSCSANTIVKFLKKKGYDVAISNDAGRFVCNYVYYHSLRYAEQKGHKSLFVHVPLFSRIDEDTQMQFAASLLEALASTS